MNTIKRILLGAALLALAGLCGQPVHADANYTATASGVTTDKSSYSIVHDPNMGSTTPATILIKVQQLSVQITGATPSSTIYVGWSMLVKVTVHTPSGSYAGSTLDTDISNGTAPALINKDGSWHHNWKLAADSTTDPNCSLTMTTTTAGSWVVEADSTITESNGHNTVAYPPATSNFTTRDVYIPYYS